MRLVKVTGAILAVIVTGMVPAYQVAGQVKEAKVTVSYVPGAGRTSPFYFFVDGEHATRERIILDRVIASNPSVQLQALIGGSVHVVKVSPDNVIRAVDAGADLVMVASNLQVPYWTLVSQPEIKTPQGLRGKILGVSEAVGSTTLFLRLLMRSFDTKDNEYDIVVIGGSQSRYAALLNKSVAAGLLTQPLDFDLIAKGYNRLGSTADVLPFWESDVLVVTRRWASANREVLIRFLRAYRAVCVWASNPVNKNVVIDLMVGGIVTKEYAGTMYGMYNNPSRRSWPRDCQVNSAGVQRVIEMMGELGQLKQPLPSARNLIDASFMDEASRK